MDLAHLVYAEDLSVATVSANAHLAGIEANNRNAA